MKTTFSVVFGFRTHSRVLIFNFIKYHPRFPVISAPELILEFSSSFDPIASETSSSFSLLLLLFSGRG